MWRHEYPVLAMSITWCRNIVNLTQFDQTIQCQDSAPNTLLNGSFTLTNGVQK